MRRFLLAALGLAALLATATIVAVHVVLALHISSTSPGKATSIISAALECIVFVTLAWLCLTLMSMFLRDLFGRYPGAVFAVALLSITVSTATSVATLICLSKSTVDMKDRVLGAKQTSFLVGSSIALGFTFALQLILVVVHFIVHRTAGLQSKSSEEDRRTPAFYVKSIPYSRTTSNLHEMPGTDSTDYRSPASSIGGRSRAGTMTSVNSSLSHAIRPITSKTRLLSLREKRRPASLDSNACRTSGEDAFDCWDTSSVDAHNRQTVLEASSPPFGKSGFLETIPASPLASRTPSPANTADWEPPRRPRSQSFSPASSIRSVRTTFTEHPSTSELHIHPLFRSDSPTPPPAATPGTVVTASPNAGQIITPRQSMRSLNRMRSDSLPTTSSPLTRDGSPEVRRLGSDPKRIQEIVEERTMTPPIPEWIMGAGSQTSLASYNSRKHA